MKQLYNRAAEVRLRADNRSVQASHGYERDLRRNAALTGFDRAPGGIHRGSANVV